ncbi:phosphatase PAP2 family protein [Lysobacter tyrosinilyticus]
MNRHDSARRRRRLTLLLIGLLLPLAAFASLAVSVDASARFSFDIPAMQWTHSWAGPVMDRAFLWISHLGFSHGVVPFDILLTLTLLVRRRWREGLFAFVALGGSIWLNGVLKDAFARPRPDLWEPMLHYPGYSFPSGHAMATMTLTWVLGLLAWRTRWRWPVLAFMSVFTALVGVSRLYMGVHYPSDVLAGWAVGAVWPAACYLVAFHHRHPWQESPLPKP